MAEPFESLSRRNSILGASPAHIQLRFSRNRSDLFRIEFRHDSVKSYSRLGTWSVLYGRSSERSLLCGLPGRYFRVCVGLPRTVAKVSLDHVCGWSVVCRCHYALFCPRNVSAADLNECTSQRLALAQLRLQRLPISNCWEPLLGPRS